MADRPPRITLVITSLCGGGAARVMVTMANYWAESGCEVTIVTFDDARSVSAYELHRAVTRRVLAQAVTARGALHAIARNLQRVKVLRRSIKEMAPHVVISFLHTMNVRTILACHGLGIPVVVSERCDPSEDDIGKTWDLLRKLTYHRAARVVAQTRVALGYFSRAVQCRGSVIPNPLPISRSGSGAPGHERTKIMMGGPALRQRSYRSGHDSLPVSSIDADSISTLGKRRCSIPGSE